MKLAIISLKSISTKMLAEECENYFDKVDLLDIRQIETKASSEGVEVLHNGDKIDDYDCVYCKGSSKYALVLQSITESLKGTCYMPLSASSFVIGHNKYLTTLELQKARISMPKSYLAATIDSAKKILKKIHYPVIIKIPSGTHGKGVMVAESFASASSVLDTMEVFKQAYIIQEFIDTGATDIRALVIGDKVVATMKRKATRGEVRANIHTGGTGLKVELSGGSERLAVKAAKAIGADIAGVDMLEGASMNVLEVNVSPGLQGITNISGVNVSGKMARFLYDQTKNFKKADSRAKYSDILKSIEKKPTTSKGHSEIITNLEIKFGKIRLPDSVTKISEFKDGEEVVVKATKGKILVKKNDEIK